MVFVVLSVAIVFDIGFGCLGGGVSSLGVGIGGIGVGVGILSGLGAGIGGIGGFVGGLDEIDPASDFTSENFCAQANCYIEKIISRGYVPIIIGGSNSYIEKLVEDPTFMFKSNYDSCFIWIDVDVSTLDPFLRKRVDHMVQKGLVDEVRGIFSPDADYSRGIRLSIGVPEMDKYFREENKFGPCEESTKKLLLESAVEEIKVNTCNLVRHQLEKIRRLMDEKMWPLHRIDATNVFKEKEKEGADNKWKHDVLKPCLEIMKEFLKQ
ncbi:putative serine/threonine-protein kinase Nek6-like [Capsicum annuum]|nr:putative serine/threonine-protein kinase Nek6-like [Capsicum annuum]KAF3682143.1 putative serine/threonine-protein kinase Nek6-like [Capsicum annuum]